MTTAPRWRRRGSGALGRLSARQALAVVYELLLHREPDGHGLETYLPALEAGTLSPVLLAERILASAEWWTVVGFTELSSSLHFSRSVFVRSLPPAGRILDLGGTALGSSQGAMVLMGYPYPFDELVVVDLPQDDRNDLYKEDTAELKVVDTGLGPVHYHYHSMTDLSSYADGSFDLVYSGQSIEHVPPAEADTVLAEVARVLRPGGYLGLDTPNARVCRLQQENYIDPDHDYEYTHAEMTQKLEAAGFEIVEAKGLNHAGRSLAAGRFSMDDTATQRGLFADIESCYLLSYLCRTAKDAP
ncbi:MAG: methyltransferase domain-containing protein [Acidimicrobiales bacterium]